MVFNYSSYNVVDDVGVQFSVKMLQDAKLYSHKIDIDSSESGI